MFAKQLYSLCAAMIQARVMLLVIEPSIIVPVQQLFHVAIEVRANRLIATEPYSKLQELG